VPPRYLTLLILAATLAAGPAFAACTDPPAPEVTWRRCLLDGRDLAGADLSRAHMRDSSLQRARLTGTKLVGADLTDARFVSADLTGADLTGATLREADLTRAVLKDAKLVRADLRRTRLFRADLSGADLTGAELAGADLSAPCWTAPPGPTARGAARRGRWEPASERRLPRPPEPGAARGGRIARRPAAGAGGRGHGQDARADHALRPPADDAPRLPEPGARP
jgi:hypothetical protein